MDLSPSRTSSMPKKGTSAAVDVSEDAGFEDPDDDNLSDEDVLRSDHQAAHSKQYYYTLLPRHRQRTLATGRAWRSFAL
jgi:hypothetical protein